MRQRAGSIRSMALACVVGMSACTGDDSGREATEGVLDRDGAATQQTEAADVRFLRDMIDHHEGLVVMAERAHERAADDSVRVVAENLHMMQAAERDTMVSMLASMFGEQHTPQPMEMHQAQADSLAQMTGVEHDRYFLETVIAHHQGALDMIDRMLPNLTTDHIRMMAENMRSAQQREIQELEGKLATL